MTETANKVRRIFHALARLGGQGGIYQALSYSALYKVLFQSICAFPAHGWARRLRRRCQRQLIATGSQELIRMMQGYATASNDWLPVIVGALPIDLCIQMRINRYRINRGLPTVIGDEIISVKDYEESDGRHNARKLVKEGMWRHGRGDMMCLRKEGTRTPSFQT